VRLLSDEIQTHFSFHSKSKKRNIFVCYIRNIWVVVVVVVAAVVVAVVEMSTFHNSYRCDIAAAGLVWTNDLPTFGSTNCTTNCTTNCSMFHCQLMLHFDAGLCLCLSPSVSSKFLSVFVQLKLRNRTLLGGVRKKLNVLEKGIRKKIQNDVGNLVIYTLRYVQSNSGITNLRL